MRKILKSLQKPNKLSRIRREFGRWRLGDPQTLALTRDEFAPGSAKWLVGTEQKFGGLQTSVQRKQVSPEDPRDIHKLNEGGMQGGDRMHHHFYAPTYAKHIEPFIGKNIVLCEVGILRGHGLAIWSDLFPTSRVIGMDIDTSNTKDHTPMLKELGAFQKNFPELYEFDQLAPNHGQLAENLSGSKIDVMIDDGIHSDEAILNTFEAFESFLAEKFVYFIEDNETVAPKLAAKYLNLTVEPHLKMTVVQPK